MGKTIRNFQKDAKKIKRQTKQSKKIKYVKTHDEK